MTLTDTSLLSDLNANERTVLKSLLNSASSNGFDFGFTDDADKGGMSVHQFAGYVSSLQSKDYIDCLESETIVNPFNLTDRITITTQFLLGDRLDDDSADDLLDTLNS